MCSSAGGHLGCFSFLATVNNAKINFMYKDLFEDLFSILLVTYLGRELLGHVVVVFNFLRNRQTVSHGGCTILHSQQSGVRVPAGPHPHQPLFSVSLITAIRMGDVVSCGFGLDFLMTSDVEYLFMRVWSFVYLLWRTVCLSLWPILKSLSF